MSCKSFHGKRALVTGAGRGIGRAIAIKLAELGATVIGISKTAEPLDTLRQQAPNIETLCVDVADWESTKAAVENIGSVDLLVNNAGIGVLQSVGQITEEVFDRTFAVNLKAAVNISQIVVNGMKARGVGGSVVNISSQAGLVALKDHAVYCCTKAALDQLTRVMALELGPYQIRVNSVNPTVVLTDMGIKTWGDPEKGKAMKEKIPLGKFCVPDDVANAVIFLLSDEASMITGSILPIDGGYTAC